MADGPSLWQRFTQAVSAGWQTARRRAGLDRVQSVMVDLSKEEMARIGPATRDVKGIYFSDFVEGMNPNQIRRAREFRKTADTLVTDRNIPLSRISRFYGVEDGKVKVGGIGNFRDSTIVVPVRNRNYGAVGHVKVERESFWDRVVFTSPLKVRAVRSEVGEQVRGLMERASELGFGANYDDPDKVRLVVHQAEWDKISEFKTWKKEYEKEEVDKLREAMDEADRRGCELDEASVYADYLAMKEQENVIRERYLSDIEQLNDLGTDLYDASMRLKHLPSVLKVRPPRNELTLFGPDGKVMSEETVMRAASVKLLMADSTGRALFVNDLMGMSDANLRRLNEELGRNPLYPVLVDNGRYSHYQLEAGSYREYIRQDLYRPDKDLFVVGSVDRAKERGVSREEGEAEAQERRMGSAKRYKKFMEDAAKTVERGIGIR